MSVRLYRDDSYAVRFSARILACEIAGDGRAAVELDRTAFYPTGGGQPHDTGMIAGRPVVDVREAEDGRILHTVIVGAGDPPVGDVDAVVDWDRRFDHMQQHTGQHILSRAFLESAAAQTRSFHLGAEECTIDIDLQQPGDSIIRRAERVASDAVFADLPVGVEKMPAESAPGDPIRIIAVGEFDRTPCGGTHVRRSGEVGAVAIRSWERFKGGTRVTFVCGRRVLTAFAALAGTVDACVRRLSARPTDLPDAVDRLLKEAAASRREAGALAEALAGCEAVALDASARAAGGARVVVEVFAGRGADDLQRLARKYVLSPARVALLATVDSAAGTSSLVFARSSEKMPESLNVGDILSAACRSRGGRGGGSATFARGGGIPADAAPAALEEAWAAVARFFAA